MTTTPNRTGPENRNRRFICTGSQDDHRTTERAGRPAQQNHLQTVTNTGTRNDTTGTATDTDESKNRENTGKSKGKTRARSDRRAAPALPVKAPHARTHENARLSVQDQEMAR